MAKAWKGSSKGMPRKRYELEGTGGTGPEVPRHSVVGKGYDLEKGAAKWGRGERRRQVPCFEICSRKRSQIPLNGSSSWMGGSAPILPE